MKKSIAIILSLVLMLSLLASCSKPAENKPAATVKIGLMPDVDSLPFIVAQEAGYFKEAGVNVELQSFKSAADRDSAFQSGAVDGVISDLLAALLAVNGGFDVKITSHTDGRYMFLASSQSGAQKISDLKGKDIGISKNTIIEFSADEMLEKEGLDPEKDVKKVIIPQVPLRLEALKSGNLGAACLPDPLATQAEKDGALVLGDTGAMGDTLGVMVFSKKAIDSKKDEIKRVYQAYEKAKEELNKNGDKYRAILVDKAGFPTAVKDTIKFPQYKKSYMPPQKDFDSVHKWMREKLLISKDISYSTLLDEQFIK